MNFRLCPDCFDSLSTWRAASLCALALWGAEAVETGDGEIDEVVEVDGFDGVSGPL
jgi:hypothetical protein